MPSSLQNLLDTGARLIRAGRLVEAQAFGETLLQSYRGHPLVHLFAADAAEARGDPKGAIAYLESLPQTPHTNAPVLLRKAQLLFGQRRRSEARTAALAAAGSLDPVPWQFRTLARILSDCLDPEGARGWLDYAHKMFPGHTPILSDLAIAEFQLNRIDEAERHLAALLQIEPFHPGAVQLRSALRTQTPERNHIHDLESRLAHEPRKIDFAVACYFALAKEYEDLQRYDKSFDALSRGTRAHRTTLKYDSQNELSAQEAIRAKFTQQAFSSVSRGFESAGPIFIVGMPRTGTTLVERILTSHSQVCGVGELTDFPLLLTEMVQETLAATPASTLEIDASLRLNFHELGRRYVESARQLAGDTPYFVDKLPYNFLYCGYILAALPNAKIIHLRRDPLDTCYAVYKTLFFNAYSYSYDQGELADYYVGYRAHMDHWHQVLPGRILDVTYEALVQDPQTQSQRILEWCALPWEASVLDFHQQDRPAMTASAMQVRKPIYTDSIGAWRRIESGFAQVHDRLARAGLLQPSDASAPRVS